MKLKVIHVNPGEKLKRYYLNDKIIQESLVLRNLILQSKYVMNTNIT